MRRILLFFLVAMVGCKQPAYRSHCAPTDDRKQLQCDVENIGEGAGKPCMRMTATHVKNGHTWEGEPWCTSVEPGKTDHHVVVFPGVDIAKECNTGRGGAWECSGTGVLKD